MSLEQAKRALLEEPAPEPDTGTGLGGWVSGHPMEAITAAAGLGLALALFPRLRKLAVPVVVATIRHALL